MYWRWVERLLLAAAVVLFALAGVGFVQSLNDGPDLSFEKAEIDAGSVAVGDESFIVEVPLRNSAGQELRVVGEQAC